ncbi:hypothetical protein BaRGS_00024022 [Batillaria attramentaria]|uniref:Uncharacterized protein n=1 Tax=Batillaria attramentaria TaxID=370345 RepID=A0ABD0KCE9_9CAEN
MKPAAIVVADEMFPEGVGPYMEIEEAGGSSALLMDLAANEKAVHADFYNGNRILRTLSCSVILLAFPSDIYRIGSMKCFACLSLCVQHSSI